MAHRRHHRSARRSKRSSKNIINKTIGQTLSVAHKFTKTTSKKYMPKVKSGLENVGSKVVKTGEQSIPFLQRMTRKFFGIFSSKSGKTRKHHRH
jgi:hypothetical protein